LTGLEHHQLDRVIVELSIVCPDKKRGRSWSLPLAQRVGLTLLQLKTNLTFRKMEGLFGVSKSQLQRVVSDITERLSWLLPEVRVDRRESWIVDGTLVPTRDHSRAARSKNYRYSTNIKVLCRRRDLSVVAVARAWPGNRNDPVAARAELGEVFEEHGRVLADSAYRAVTGCITPVMKDRKIVRDQAFIEHRRKRARVEHLLARLKDWRVLRDHRRKGVSIDHTIRAVAALWNLRVALP
jgi:hypothetical protein